MKVLPLSFLFAFLFFSTPAQENRKKEQLQFFPLSVVYGSKLLQQEPFNGQLNTVKQFSPGSSLRYAGICLNYRVQLNAWQQMHPYLSYMQVIPQDLQLNDSVHARLYGFQVSAAFYGYGLLRQVHRSNNIYVMLGFNTGTLKMKYPDGSLRLNRYFSPKISLVPSFKISRINLALMIDYEYDVSKKAWKSNSSADSQPIPGKLSQTGLSVTAGLGFYFRYKSDLEKKTERNKRRKKARNKR